jgi:hypothetical protein
MYLRETGWKDVDWLHLAQGQAVMNTVMNLRVTKRPGISWLAEWILVC